MDYKSIRGQYQTRFQFHQIRFKPNTTATTESPGTTITPTTFPPFFNSSGDMFSDIDMETLNEIYNREKNAHRISNVPLCRSDCDYWWNACKQEYFETIVSYHFHGYSTIFSFCNKVN